MFRPFKYYHLFDDNKKSFVVMSQCKKKPDIELSKDDPPFKRRIRLRELQPHERKLVLKTQYEEYQHHRRTKHPERYRKEFMVQQLKK